MNIIIFEDQFTKDLRPFTYNHGSFEVKTGMMSNLDRFVKALSSFEEALQLFKELGDKAGKAAVLFIIGVTYWRKCEWDRALQILENALNLKTDKDNRFVSLYGAFDRGLLTLQNRIRLGRELEQPMKILQPLFSSIALHLIEGNWEAFKTCLEESEVLAKQIGHRDILKAILKISQLADQFS